MSKTGTPFPSLEMTLSGHHRPYRPGRPPHSHGFRPEAGYTKCGSEAGGIRTAKQVPLLPAQRVVREVVRRERMM